MISKYRLGSLAAVALFVVGCSGSAATSAPASQAPASQAPASQAPASQAPASQAPASQAVEQLSGTLTIWDSYGSGGSAEGDAMTAVLAKAKTTFPNLTVNRVVVAFDQLFNKINAGWGAGDTTPDMFIAPNDSLGDQQRLGILYGPLDDKLGAMQANFTQIAIDGSKVDGKMYEIPESMKAVAMFYNKDLVKTPPASLDDLLALQKSGVKVGIAQYAGGYYNWGFYSAFGGKILDDSGKCVASDKGVADALGYLKKLKDAGATFYTEGPAFQGDFKSGKLGVVIEGPWATGDFKKALGDKLGVMKVPPGPAGKFQPMAAPDGWYINANSPNKDLAIKFALWEVSSQGGEQIFADQAGHLPADKTVTVTDPVSKVFLDQINDGYPRPQNKELSTYWSNFADAQQSVLDKGTDPKAAVDKACQAMNTANKK